MSHKQFWVTVGAVITAQLITGAVSYYALRGKLVKHG